MFAWSRTYVRIRTVPEGVSETHCRPRSKHSRKVLESVSAPAIRIFIRLNQFA